MTMIISDELARILDYATDEAMRTGSGEVGVDHVVLAIVRDGENEAADILRMLGVDLQELKHFVESRLSRGVMVPYSHRDSVTVSRNVQGLVNVAMSEASSRGTGITGSAYVLSSIFSFPAGVGRAFLSELGITKEAVLKLAAEVVQTGNEEAHATSLTHAGAGFIGISTGNNKIAS